MPKFLAVIKGWIVAHKLISIGIGVGAAAVLATSIAVPVSVANHKFTIAWKNEDGTVLVETKVKRGDMPEYPDQAPTKAETAQYSYTFAGWEPEIVEAKANADYTAKFTSTVKSYEVKFLDEDGTTELKKETLQYGATPVAPANPDKADTDEWDYSFTGWDKPIGEVQGAQTYTATYSATKKQYLVRFLDENGTELKGEMLDYGATPVAPANPEKADTAEWDYTFTGWDKPINVVQGEQTYTAQYSQTKQKYTVLWKDFDGTVLETDTDVEYGTTPEFIGADPTRDKDAQYTYAFTGWDKTISEVHGNQEYVATYSSTLNKYTVVWKNWNGDILETDENVTYGTTPTYDGADPTKAKTAEITYTWNGWESEVLPVEGNQVYVAHFDESKTKYTIAWKNWDDSTLDTAEPVVVDYDAEPVYPNADPECDEYDYLDYSFAGFEEVEPRDEENYIRTFKAKFDVVQTKDENFNYSLINDDTEYKITGFSGTPRAKVYIPSSHDDKPITQIGANAFSSNNAITEVHIPSSVTKINGSAFYMCQNLETIDIQGAPDIDSTAFAYSYRVKSISIKGGSAYSINNFAFEYAGYYLTGDDVTTVSLGEGLVDTGYSSFYFSRIDSLVLPASLEIVNEYSFYYCNKLQSVSFAEDSNINDIKGYSFYHCPELEDVSFPEGLIYIRTSAFQDCDKLEEIVLPDSLTSLSGSSFAGCDKLANVKLGKGLVSSIGYSSAFYDTPVEAFEIDDDHPYLSTQDGILFNKDASKILCYPSAHEGTEYEIPSTVTSMAEYAFRGANKLQEVTTPSGLTSIAYAAFQYCSGLNTITFGGNITTVSEYAFANTGLESITFGTSLINLASTAFKGAGSLTEIVIPSENAKYAISDSLVVYEKKDGDKVKLLFVLPSLTTTFTIPSTVTEIAENALAYSNVPSLTVPNTVTKLGQYAFSYSKIEEVTLGTGITKIPYQCFYQCGNIEDFVIPSSVIEIGEQAFYHASKLKAIELPDACKTIGDYAFDGCKKLASVDLNKVEKIGDWAFAYDDELTEITIPDTVKTVDSYAFRECTKLEEATIGCETLGAYAFYFDNALTKVTLTDNVKTIREAAFQYDKNLLEVVMGDGLELIEGYAFYQCEKLGGKNALDVEVGFTLPASIKGIGHYAFYACYELHTLHFDGTKTEFIETMTPNWSYSYITNQYSGFSSYFCEFSSSRVNRVVCSDGAGNITGKIAVSWDA